MESGCVVEKKNEMNVSFQVETFFREFLHGMTKTKSIWNYLQLFQLSTLSLVLKPHKTIFLWKSSTRFLILCL